MNKAGITSGLVKFSDVLVGHIRGGLAHVNIVASIFFRHYRDCCSRYRSLRIDPHPSHGGTRL